MEIPTKKINIVFIGTPKFAVPAFLELMTCQEIKISAVITQPDKPVGRKQILQAPAVKIAAQEHHLPIYQPIKIIKLEDELRRLQSDIILVIAYDQLIPPSILNLPRLGCINVHGSLLPKYRGAACIPHSIINGDQKTGITIMKMDQGLDTGPIIKQEIVEISDDETSGSLLAKLALLAARTLPQTIINYVSGQLVPQPQDESQAVKVTKINQDDARINWQQSAQQIDRLIRAMQPWPVAWSTWNQKKVKILETKLISFPTLKIVFDSKPGKLFYLDGELAVLCGQDALLIKKLQLEGKKKVTADEFIRGHRHLIGSILV